MSRLNVIATAESQLRQRIAATPVGNCIVDGSQYSPSDRALPAGHYVWDLDDQDAWEEFSEHMLVVADETGCYWEDGVLWRGPS